MNANPLYVSGYTTQDDTVECQASTSYRIAVETLIEQMEADASNDPVNGDVIGDAIATFAHSLPSSELMQVDAGPTTYWVVAR